MNPLQALIAMGLSITTLIEFGIILTFIKNIKIKIK